MTAAVGVACQFAVEQWNLVRISAPVFDGNVGSQRVLEKPTENGIMEEDKTMKGKRDDVDGVVRQFVEACLDASTGDHRADLADSLPRDSRHVWLCLRAGVPTEVTLDRCSAVRHQPRRQYRLHTNPVRPA